MDLKAKRWLAGYLGQYKGTVVLVTHEEVRLGRDSDATRTRLGEVEYGELGEDSEL